LDGKQNVWTIEPATRGAKLGVQIRCGPLVRPGKAYRSPRVVTLETFDDLAPYAKDSTATKPVARIGPSEGGSVKEGVTQGFASVAEGPPEGPRCGRYTATSTLADSTGWCVIGKRFDRPLDLSWHKAIGLWVRGDGKGGSFKLQLRDDRHATDYYISNDFREWRYFQLPRPAKPQPEPIDYSRVAELLLYYNGLPAGATITCWIDDIKALAELDEATVVNPTIVVGATRLAFPVTLHEGERLVFLPGGPPEIVPPRAGERQKLASMEAAQLSGDQTVVFQAAEPPTAHVEVRLVQDCPEELLLPQEAARDF